ncbi:hypothetical protein VTI74DRAFT_5333 [Chaetomium olivicolor]
MDPASHWQHHQVQRQAEALAQDPPRPLNAHTLPSSFDPNEQNPGLPTAISATNQPGPAILRPVNPAEWSCFPCLPDLSRHFEGSTMP